MAVRPRGGGSDGDGGKPTQQGGAAPAETAEGSERTPSAYRLLKLVEEEPVGE